MTPRQEQLLALVSREFAVPVEDILGKSHEYPIVLARHAAMHVFRKWLSLSLKQVAMALGGTHHTTVLYGLRSFRNRLAEDAELARTIQDLREQWQQTPPMDATQEQETNRATRLALKALKPIAHSRRHLTQILSQARAYLSTARC